MERQIKNSSDSSSEASLSSFAGLELNFVQRFFLFIISFYRRYLSSLKGFPCCRFQPSCSEYALQAIIRHGSFRGVFLSFWRILRCNPFYRGSVYDPVPEIKSKVSYE